jgi:hypothetical protein
MNMRQGRKEEAMRQLTPNPALQRLDALVGEWEMESPQYPGGRGRATFEWLEGGAFLVQHTEVDHGEVPNATVIIGRDESTERYCMLYYDSRGVSRVYQMSLGDGVWKMWREAPGFSQRFTGTFGDNGQTITGRWESSSDGSHWEHDFDLTYKKVT